MENKAKYRKPSIWILIGVCFIAGIFTFTYSTIITDRTESPNGEYRTWNNRITKTTTVQHISSGTKSYFGNRGRPSLLWAPDRSLLALTASGSNGSRRTEMIDFAYGMASGIIPTKFDIQKELGRERTDEKDNTRVEVTKWLDSNHVLVEFSWPGDEWEPSVQGWLIFDLSAYAIKAITASGCDRNSGEAEEPMTDSGEQSDIIVEIDPPIIHLGDLSEPLSLRIKNLSEEEYRGGYHYNLEIYDNGEWKEVPLMLNQIFNDIGLIIEPGGEVVWPLNLMRYERDNFDFVPGRYRVVYDKWHGEFMIGFISE